MGTNCYRQWLVSLVPSETRLFLSEIQIYQTIQLTNKYGNQLNFYYLIYIIIDNFIIFKAYYLLTRVTTYARLKT
jgi:hypothetical protein